MSDLSVATKWIKGYLGTPSQLAFFSIYHHGPPRIARITVNTHLYPGRTGPPFQSPNKVFEFSFLESESSKNYIKEYIVRTCIDGHSDKCYPEDKAAWTCRDDGTVDPCYQWTVLANRAANKIFHPGITQTIEKRSIAMPVNQEDEQVELYYDPQLEKHKKGIKTNCKDAVTFWHLFSKKISLLFGENLEPATWSMHLNYWLPLAFEIVASFKGYKADVKTIIWTSAGDTPSDSIEVSEYQKMPVVDVRNGSTKVQ